MMGSMCAWMPLAKWEGWWEAERWAPRRDPTLSLHYLSLLARSEWWMGSLAWLVSLEQAIRTPGPCEIIPSFTATRLSMVLRALELSFLSLTHTLVLCASSFFLPTHTLHHSALREVTEAVCNTGGGGLCSLMWMKTSVHACAHEGKRSAFVRVNHKAK